MRKTKIKSNLWAYLMSSSDETGRLLAFAMLASFWRAWKIAVDKICSASFNCFCNWFISWSYFIKLKFKKKFAQILKPADVNILLTWRLTWARKSSIFCSIVACSAANSNTDFNSLSFKTNNSTNWACSALEIFWCFGAIVFSINSL